MPHQPEIDERPRRWVVNSDSRLIWKSWDSDEFVVYSTASGDTHQLNKVTAEVLRQLEHAALEFSDLARNVADALGAELDDQTETYVARLLAHLDQIGLVELVP